MSTGSDDSSHKSMYRVDRYSWPNRRGQNLCVYTYRCKDPVAAVFFHHGFCEYCGWWKRMFTVLVEAGIDVYAYDMHGHGLSEPQHEEGRVCIVNADHLVEDAEDILDGIIEPALRGDSPDAASAAAGGGGDTNSDSGVAARDADVSGSIGECGGCADVGAADTSAAGAKMAGSAAAQVAADLGDAAESATQAVKDGLAATSATLQSQQRPASSSSCPSDDGESASGSESGGEDGSGAGDFGRGARRVKLFGVAHSLGGGVLSLLEAKRPGTFAGLALNAPALGRKLTFLDNVAMMVVGAMRSLCPTAQLVPSTPWPLLSDDDEVPRRAGEDAAYFNGACRIVTAYSIATLFQQLNATAGSVRCPVYVQWASEEKITCRAAAEAFVAELSDHEVTWDEIRNARHVMIHGRRGPVLVRAIRDWIVARLGDPSAPPSAAEDGTSEAAAPSVHSGEGEEDVERFNEKTQDEKSDGSPVADASDESDDSGDMSENEDGDVDAENEGARVVAALKEKEGRDQGDMAGWPVGKAGNGPVERLPVLRAGEEEAGGHLLSVVSAACASDRSSDSGCSGRMPSAGLPAHLPEETSAHL